MHMHYYTLHRPILSVPQDKQEIWQVLEPEAHNGVIQVTSSLAAFSFPNQMIRNALKTGLNKTDCGVNS